MQLFPKELPMKASCISTLAALLVAFPAMAQPSVSALRPGPVPAFVDFDANGDGRITDQEFNDARNKRIAERATEGRAMRGLSQAADFKAIDANGDGVISKEEFDAHQSRHRIDRPATPAR